MAIEDWPPPPEWMCDYALDREIEQLQDDEAWRRLLSEGL